MSAIILVIDDSEDDQRLYQRAFKDFDCFFSLKMTSSAEAGLASAIAHKPDLILLDYNLPDIDGLSFIKKLATHSDTPIPIIMLTGESSAAVAVEVMKHGADDYLVKDTEGRYLRLLPSVVGRVMAAHAQRAEAQRLRQETETLLLRNQILMQNSMDGIHVMDMQGNIVESNDAFCRMLGYTREEAARLNVADWDAHWSAEELRERFKELIGKSARFETIHRRKDGVLIDVEVSTSGMMIEGQYFLFAASRDISERKRTEKRIAYSESLFRGLFENMSSGVAVYSAVDDGEDFIFSDFNHAGELMENVKREDVIGKRLTDCFPGVKEFGLLAVFQRVWKTGEPENLPISFYQDGRITGWRDNHVYRLPSGEVVAAYDDVTARMQAEQSLKKSEANMRAMLDNSPYLTWLKDTEGRYITINKVFADYLRLEDSRQAVGKTDLELQPKELAEKYRADDAGVMAARQQKHVEESAFDGHTTHWVETFKTPIIDAQDKVLGTVGFARDITERKRMQLETEALLRRNLALMKTSMDGIHVLDTQGNLLDTNDAFCRMLGYSRDEMADFNVADWAAEFSAEELRVRINDHVGKSVMIETLHRRKDGALINVEISVTGEEIDGQNLLFCSSRDITERKKAEKKLLLKNQTERKRAEELAQQFGQLLQNSFNEIYMFDANSLKFILTSEGAEKNLGYSDDELNQLTPLDLKPSYTRESFESLVAPLRRGTQPSLLFETTHRRKDGTTYPVEVRLQLMQTETLVFLAIIQDITERKAAEEGLHFHSNILKNLVEGVMLVSASDGVIVFTNLQFENMLGYGSGELLGKQVSIVNAPGEYGDEAVANAIMGELARSGIWSGEVQNIRKDGTAFWCHANVSGFEHSQFGKVWVSVHEDITERKLAEQQARELSAHLQTVREEEKASFAREIHDDLGGTLAALKMDASWLASKLPAETEMLPLRECVKSMGGLLDTAVLATRRIITELRPSVLDDLGLMEALRWQSAQFHRRTGIECRVIYVCSEDQDCEDELDGTLSINLFRIFQEALTNVARHSGASKVAVELHREDEEVALSISDNGRGLPQGHAIGSTSYGMRGMRERVVQLGGKIKFDSPPGGGFSVTVMLPLPAGNKK